MTTYDASNPDSIRESMKWMTVFRECKHTVVGPWLSISFADVALTMEWDRTDPASAEKMVAALELGLNGISAAFPEVTPQSVQNTVAAVAQANRRRLAIAGGVMISATSKLVTIHLTARAHHALTQARQSAHTDLELAVSRANVLHLLDIIAEGTTDTIAGKIVTRQASDAIDLLVEKAGLILQLPPKLAIPKDQDED